MKELFNLNISKYFNNNNSNNSNNIPHFNLLAYVNVPQFAESIIQECNRWYTLSQLYNLPFTFHLFLFRKQEPDINFISPNLTCIQVDRVKFISMLKVCNALITTAGVESICEAMLFKKPALIVPGIDDDEQYTNAYLFSTQMKAIFGQTNFIFDTLFKYLLYHSPFYNNIQDHEYYNQCKQVEHWLNNHEKQFINIFTNILSRENII